MSVSIEKASINEYEEIIDFANNAFMFESENRQFQNILPKLYQNHSEIAENHFLLRRDGELEGLLLCQPDTLEMLGYEIPFYKIGTVSVSAAARGCGHMERLMCYTNDFMKESKAVFGVLGGLRHRYERFGFHPASCFFAASFTAYTLVKKENQLSADIVLSNLEEDAKWVGEALAMHDEQTMHCQRDKEGFLSILKSWSSTSFAIHRGTEFIGYCCIRQKEDTVTVEEILLENPKYALDIVKCLGKIYPQNKIVVELPMASLLAEIFLMNCDEYILLPKSSYHVLDFVRLIEPLLKVAVIERNIPDIKMAFIIEGKPVYIEICKKSVLVTNEIPSGISPISLNEAQATQIFFGPLGLLPVNIPSGVFPLPLFVPNQDCC